MGLRHVSHHAKTKKVPPQLKGDMKILAEYFNRTLDSKLESHEAKMESKLDEMNNKIMVAAQTTDTNLKEMSVEREKQKK